MEAEEKLKVLRRKIDSVDEQILRLLNERADTALQVGKVKAESGIDPYNPLREEAILQNLQGQNPGPFPGRAISAVYREIISACRSLETELTVVYLGPPATYTHLACIERFGSSAQAVPKESIQEVFEAVEREKAHFGVVPIENSTEGVVNRTLDMFIDSDVKICGEVLSRIFHDLLSRDGRLAGIEKVYSHPQALGQCRQWLRKNLPYAQLAETVSTSRAAQMALEDPKAAAIASSFAARLYGLKIVEARIEDYAHNFTRFLILGRQVTPPTGRDKASYLFSISDAPGALYQVLKPFSEKSINLTKIESRPIKDRPWQYVFFLDFEGHATDPAAQEAVAELKKNVIFLKFLGSYPRSA